MIASGPRLHALWPLPALAAWGLGWCLFAGLRAAGLPLALAAGVGALGAAAAAPLGDSLRRRACIALGFPLSLAASGVASGLPGWAWLLPLALVALAYPVGAWRDAPMFPTPAGALRGLGARVPLPAGATILDAGCGLGDALVELRREYPRQRLVGIEWSWPLRLACGWRCRFATVRRANLWSADWSGCDMVYVFQRPDTMQRVAEKAGREMRAGTWLASLEFAVPGRRPDRVIACAGGRRVWLYRIGAPDASSPRADGR